MALTEQERKARHAEAMRRWRAKSKLHLAEYMRGYYAENKDHIIGLRKKNPNVKAYAQKYAEEHKEQSAEQHKRWLKENRDRWNAYQREYKRKKRATMKMQ